MKEGKLFELKAEANFWRKETLKWVRGVVQNDYALDDARCAHEQWRLALDKVGMEPLGFEELVSLTRIDAFLRKRGRKAIFPPLTHDQTKQTR